MPNITIIVPVYNVEEYLSRCLDSILVQSFTDFELILVDDGSPDGSGAICDDYAQKDGRIRVIHQHNGGAASARNTGLDSAVGDWIAFIDSDDWVHPDYLRIMHEAAVQKDADVVACKYKMVYEGAEITDLPMIPLYSSENREDYWVDDRIGAVVPWGKLYRRRLFEELRFPVGRTAEDEFITHRMLFGCKTLVVLNNELYWYYYANSASVTHSNYLGRLHDAQDALYQHIVFFENSPWRRAYQAEIGYYLETWAIAIRITRKQRDKESKQCIAELRSELRRKMNMYKGLIPANKKGTIYEAAYPWSRWFIRGAGFLKRKIKHE